MKNVIWFNGFNKISNTSKALIAIAGISLYWLLNVDTTEAQQLTKFPSGIYFNNKKIDNINPNTSKIIYQSPKIAIIEGKGKVYKIIFSSEYEYDITNNGNFVIVNNDTLWHYNDKMEMEILEWADIATFQVFNDCMAFDKNNMYFFDYDGSDAWYFQKNNYDTKTLKIVKTHSGNFLCDKNWVYFRGHQKIEWIDPLTFWPLIDNSYSIYIKDQSSVFRLSWLFFEADNVKKLEWLNPDSTIMLSWEDDLVTDNKTVFYRWRKIEWINIPTLQNKWRWLIDDKNVWLSEWNKVEWADPKTFKELQIEDPLYEYEDINSYYDRDGKQYPKNQ